MFTTKKLYYTDQWCGTTETEWRKEGETSIAVAASVAFPEGGGQLGDSGVLIQGSNVVRFKDTQKQFGRPVFMSDFPAIQVEGEIQLELDAAGDNLDATLPLTIKLDCERRAKLTRSHTAAHLVYVGLMKVVESVTRKTVGCYIHPDGGRFDLSAEKLTQDDLLRIGELCSEWVANDYAIEMTAKPGEPECRIWNCNGIAIPCGGLHLSSTKHIGPVTVKRRSQGRGTERIYYAVEPICPPEIVGLFGNLAIE